MNNTTRCIEGFRPSLLNLPSEIVLSVALPMIVLGVLTNLSVLTLLVTQKRFSNQDIYVFVLCLSSFVMIGPCFATNLLKNWPNCSTLPRVLVDMLTIGLQVTAGVNVWLTCSISIDRFLIVYYHAAYPVKETQRRVLSKISAIIVTHLLAAAFSNLVHYAPGALLTTTTPTVMDPLELLTTELMSKPKPFSSAIQLANQIVNVARLAADRVVPWFLCPTTYVAVFLLRNRQRASLKRKTPVSAAAAPSAISTPTADGRRLAERRIRRSRKLVVGISLSLFISLLPETILDFSNYALNMDLRSRAPAIGLIWYVPNIIDPLICIVSLPNLKRRARTMLEKFGMSRVSSAVGTVVV